MMGAGSSTCADYTQEYRRDPDTANNLYFSWAQGFMSGQNVARGFRRGWHDFSFSRGCVPLPNLAGQADAQTLGGVYEVPPVFSVRLTTQWWT
jgi:hypothetical protein